MFFSEGSCISSLVFLKISSQIKLLLTMLAFHARVPGIQLRLLRVDFGQSGQQVIAQAFESLPFRWGTRMEFPILFSPSPGCFRCLDQ